MGVLWAGLGLQGCDPDDTGDPGATTVKDTVDVSLLEFAYAPTTYDYAVPSYFPRMAQPDSNVATEAGVALGRLLFFDPILSRDSTFSCGTCHKPELAYTDGLAVSKGIDGLTTSRSSMSLINVAFQTTFFWDGRSGSLEEQSLHPVEDQIELAGDWIEIENRLRRSPTYRKAFRAAFGLERSAEIDRYTAAKAIAQFERSLISASSEYDRVSHRLDGFFSSSAERGRDLFFTEPDIQHPGCAHCHNAPLFGDNRFSNNGLVAAETVADFEDRGRAIVTGELRDYGKFRAPTLRNIALTAPYMHDGRLADLDAVLDHYSSGGHYSPTRDAQITGFKLTASDRADLKAFLATLTDTIALQRPGVRAPR